MNRADLDHVYSAIRDEATQLAGGLTDLAQRATTYHHLYTDSGGDHVFPLIAAHGTLWSRGYFRFGMRLGRILSMQFAFNSQRRREHLAAMDAFGNAFRDINRRVCVDTYTNYHFVGRFGDQPGADNLLSIPLFESLQRVHWAKRNARRLTDAERLAVFTSHFLNEQEHVVSPVIAQAMSQFDWPAVKWFALQPVVRFAYFPSWRVIRFRNFANVEERIAKGLRAFAMGAQVGWPTVADKLRHYRVMPAAFFAEGPGFFARLRERTISGPMTT